jgi:hypothetical protein
MLILLLGAFLPNTEEGTIVGTPMTVEATAPLAVSDRNSLRETEVFDSFDIERLGASYCNCTIFEICATAIALK